MGAKRARHEAILELVRTRRVTSQEGLRELLLDRGFDVTQATVSRDVRELRLVKTPEADGAGRYTTAEGHDSTPALSGLLPALFRSAEGSRNLLVVRTLAGGAQPVALAIDGEDWPEVLGTLGGDDTILVICRRDVDTARVRERLERLAGAGG
ncbi:MAG: hypothetical protein RLN75_09235 [Longimicrobiales bacterium]